MKTNESPTPKVEIGDLYQDLDRRNVSPRVVKVLNVYATDITRVKNVEHWNEKLIGRTTWIRTDRLLSRRFRKVSR